LIKETKTDRICIEKYDSKQNLIEEKNYNKTIIVQDNNSKENLTDEYTKVSQLLNC
jgi:hypothetical protein